MDGVLVHEGVALPGAVEFLTRRRRDHRVEAITVALGAEMLVLGGLAADRDEASAKLTASLDSGRAAEIFGHMVSALGGPADFMDSYGKYLATSPVIRAVRLEGEGVVTGIDTRAVGVAVVEMGGGRAKAADVIDHSVGFTELVGVGTRLAPGQPIGIVHARDAASADRAAERLRSAYQLGSSVPRPNPLIAHAIRR
jgi:thymidine phosphorylase